VVLGLLVALNRSSIYRPWPYAALGVLLWWSLHLAGLHATLAGVLLAILIPTRPPAHLSALLAQAEAVIASESESSGTALRNGPSMPTLKAIDAIHDRIESPADRLLRTIEPWSSYFVLPIFALVNAGLVISGDLFSERTMLASAIAAALIIGKPVGFLLAALLVLRLKWADRPKGLSLMQVVGAGSLAGIGFTMSVFIAGQAFSGAQDFAAAKAAILGASLVSGTIGCVILMRTRSPVGN
jgi:Na+:H+ antiporter, NhaA family